MPNRMLFIASWILVLLPGDWNLTQLQAAIKPHQLPRQMMTSKSSPSVFNAIDANNLVLWVQNNGLFASQFPENYGLGLLYPKIENGRRNTQRGLIFFSGLFMGARIHDSLRTIVNFYSHDTEPGALDSSGQPYGQSDPAFRVYKIGAAPEFRTSVDYLEWPHQQGAPLTSDGQPQVIGDQTLWCCFTDGYAYPLGHRTTQTAPLGAEIHLLVYAWENLENVIFLRWDMLNKSRDFWKQTYVGFFVDCELGMAHDDLVGSDSTLQLAYDYNADDVDDGEYERFIPAVGYALLQTPRQPALRDTARCGYRRQPGYRNVAAFAPLQYEYGWNFQPGLWRDFFLSNISALPAYLRLQGLNEKGTPMIDPTSGRRTNWGLSGDPVAGTGWLDIQEEDRRFMLSAGPFDMAPGDTQTVVLAAAVGHGKDRFDSITLLKRMAALAHAVHSYPAVLFMNQLSADPAQIEVEIPVTFLNPSHSYSELNFEVKVDPQYLTITRMVLSDRTSHLPFSSKSLTAGQFQVSIGNQAQKITPGSAPILHLKARFNPRVSKRRIEVNFTHISAQDSTGQTQSIPAFIGSILLNRAPRPAGLITPPDHYRLETFDELKALRFSWHPAQELDGDSITYRGQWINSEYPFFTTADTCFRFNGQGFFQAGKTYRWTLTAADQQIQKACPDTFQFTVAELNQLACIYETTLPKQYDFFARGMLQDKDLLLIRGVESEGDIYREVIFSYQLTNPAEPLFLERYEFPRFSSLKGFTIQNKLLYALGNYGTNYGALMVMDYRDSVKSRLVTQLELKYDDPRSLMIQDDRLFIFARNPRPKMMIFDLTQPLAPVQQGSLNLPHDINYSHYQLVNWHLYYAVESPQKNYLFKAYRLDPAFKMTDSTSMPLSGPVASLMADDQYVYLAIDVGNKYWDNTRGVELYLMELTDPLRPWSMSRIPTRFTPARGWRTSPQRLMLVQSSALEIYDLQTPENPVQISHYYGLDKAIVLHQGFIYGTTFPAKLRVLDAGQQTPIEFNPRPAPSFHLHQNYPNPFNAQTLIAYSVSGPANMSLEIFDILGRQVKHVEQYLTEAGNLYLNWDGCTNKGQTCASGIYFYRLRIGGATKMKKMVKF